MKSKNPYNFPLQEIRAIQKAAEEMLVTGKLRAPEVGIESCGICAGLEDRLKFITNGYDFMAAFLDSRPAYGGLEDSGHFGEIRQGVLMFIVELTPKELQEIVHSKMVSGL